MILRGGNKAPKENWYHIKKLLECLKFIITHLKVIHIVCVTLDKYATSLPEYKVNADSLPAFHNGMLQSALELKVSKVQKESERRQKIFGHVTLTLMNNQMCLQFMDYKRILEQEKHPTDPINPKIIFKQTTYGKFLSAAEPVGEAAALLIQVYTKLQELYDDAVRPKVNSTKYATVANYGGTGKKKKSKLGISLPEDPDCGTDGVLRVNHALQFMRHVLKHTSVYVKQICSLVVLLAEDEISPLERRLAIVLLETVKKTTFLEKERNVGSSWRPIL
jgi:hypothetical protein